MSLELFFLCQNTKVTISHSIDLFYSHKWSRLEVIPKWLEICFWVRARVYVCLIGPSCRCASNVQDSKSESSCLNTLIWKQVDLAQRQQSLSSAFAGRRRCWGSPQRGIKERFHLISSFPSGRHSPRLTHADLHFPTLCILERGFLLILSAADWISIECTKQEIVSMTRSSFEKNTLEMYLFQLEIFIEVYEYCALICGKRYPSYSSILCIWYQIIIIIRIVYSFVQFIKQQIDSGGHFA